MIVVSLFLWNVIEFWKFGDLNESLFDVLFVLENVFKFEMIEFI